MSQTISVLKRENGEHDIVIVDSITKPGGGEFRRRFTLRDVKFIMSADGPVYLGPPTEMAKPTIAAVAYEKFLVEKL